MISKTGIALAVLTLTFATAQTIIPGGNVSGTWTQSGSPYLVQGEITIPASQTLVIEPGVEVNFQGYYKFIVNGTLEAIGTAVDSILFTATDTIFGWRGIRFIHATGGHLTYCILQYGRASGGTPDGRGGAIYVDNSLPIISHCLIWHNTAYGVGGALYSDSSSISISNCVIINNSATSTGGGLYFFCCNPVINNSTISDNSTGSSGGGVSAEGWSYTISANSCIFNNNHANGAGGAVDGDNSNFNFQNCVFTNNSSDSWGGAFHEWHGNTVFNRCTFTGNSAYSGGGAIVLSDEASSLTHSLTSCLISGNSAGSKGGGLYAALYGSSAVNLQNVTVSFNTAGQMGGGIYNTQYGGPNFSSTNRCNIYFNQAPTGNDLYTDHIMEVVLDTFTVLNPTNYYATPISSYTFDILHGALTQTNADLYVSPTGNNYNSGLSWQEPLRNIWYALSIIEADSLNPHTIHLAPGTYSPSINEEIYPLICNSYVSLQGSGENLTVLDAESTARVLHLEGIQDLTIEQMTIKGGAEYTGAGIYALEAEALIEHCTIRENMAAGDAYGGGGGIYSAGAKLSVNYCTITENIARLLSYGGGGGGGAIWCGDDSSTYSYCTISNNLADSIACGGAIVCYGYPVFRYCTITGNHSDGRGGVTHIASNGHLTFENCTISGNSSSPTAACIDLYYASSATITNTIIEGCLGSPAMGFYGYNADAEITYSDFCNNALGNFNGTNLPPGLGLITAINANEDSCDQYYNIYLDPRFVAPQNSDYHLQENSPCIDAGDPASPYDPDYTVADIGAWYYDQSTPVAIVVTPYNAPIMIPAGGGSFQFDLEIHNDDTLAYTVDVFTTVTLPGGAQYPIFTRSNILLSPGAIIIRDSLTQYVPASAAPGLYYYNAYVRDHYTWETLDQSSFPFEKLYGVDTPKHNHDWELKGW